MKSQEQYQDHIEKKGKEFMKEHHKRKNDKRAIRC